MNQTERTDTTTRLPATDTSLGSEQLSALLDHSRDGLGVVGEDTHIRYANMPLAAIFGYSAPDQLKGVSLSRLLNLNDSLDRNHLAMEELEKKGVYRGELVGTGKDGRALHTEIHITRLSNGESLLLVRDVTRRKRAEKTLYYHAFYDSLTGLSNRALLIDRMKLAIKRRQRSPEQRFALLLMDLDRFKIINESLGYDIGDLLLQEVARRLVAVVRQQDTVARFGGDEFGILIDDSLDELDIGVLMERINSELSRPFFLNGQEVFSSVSTGVVISSESGDVPEQLLRHAEIAMARAKSKGKSQFQLFDPNMGRQAKALLRLETDLRKAVRHDEFTAFYQPIMSLEENRLIGFEALARWNHPERGLVMPGEFISLAEESGLILPIGMAIMTKACMQLKEWTNRFGSGLAVTMSVNISGIQFMQPDFPELVAGVLESSNIPSSCLKLEITESVIMENAETATRILSRLKDLGLELAIDDFGTGYSSLSYLHRLPVDILKIDRSFISAGAASDSMDIPETIITLAHHLGMRVVAEGIENTDQAERLRDMRCEYGQGYLYAKPLPSDEAAILLAKG